MRQRATLYELAHFDECEPELFRQMNQRSECVIVVARKEGDAVPALDIRVGSQFGRTQVIESPLPTWRR